MNKIAGGQTVRQKTYRTPDGREYPLQEAEYDIAFMAYKSDRKKAKIGDPTDCLLALGIKRNPDVQEAFIGSGKDAYVIFRRGIAVHFTVNAKAAKIRDTFDTKGSPSTQMVMLSAPSSSRTLQRRSELNRKRKNEIKDGSPIKKRGPQKNKRITALGIAHRPRAKIINGFVEVPASQ